ncbi:MAG TPA: phosphoribosyltransferase family protein [Solirubrobacteraceae bacterium]
MAGPLEQVLRRGSAAPVILGLPRGGVVVASAVASALCLPLDVLVARKIGAPGNRELGIAALAEDGTLVLSEGLLRELRIGRRELRRRVLDTEVQLRRCVRLYRGEASPIALFDRTAVIVDDGLATGNTALAAIHATRARGAARIICAVPVGARSTVVELREQADEVICLLEPEPLQAIGAWYQDFAQVSESEVLMLLAQARQRTG